MLTVVAKPALIDRAFRLAYRVGYRLARVWWRLRRPQHHGAMVAVWLDGQILGVRQSYTNRITWPGGGIEPGEDPAEAAQRELREELGLTVGKQELALVRTITAVCDYRHDNVRVFELHLTEPPTLKPDGREITEAGFMSPQDMLAAGVTAFIRTYLRERPATGG